MFEALGATVRSADVDARLVLSDGSQALDAVYSLFPEVQQPDGTLNRSALASRIFTNAQDKARLESITHPLIIERIRSAIDAARASTDPGILFYEVPLLYERNLSNLFDAVVAVLATPELQAERLQAREARAGRPALTSDAVADRLAAQMPPEEKARRADYVIRTETTLAETEEQVQRVWDKIVSD